MQTEQLTDHHAMRLTVEIEPERLQKAKVRAAEKLAKKVNIPGFRKGKAPYRVIVGYFGEGAILEDAIEILGNDVYKEVLKNANIEPYGPGQIEDVKLEEEKPVLTFVVPLQPRISLNNYRDVRQDYTAADVTDTDVDRAMLALQEQHAVVEDTDKTAAKGTRVTVDLDARLVEEDAEAEAEAEEAAVEDQHAEEGHDHEHDHHIDKNTIIHQHDAVLSLAGEDPVIPGFIDAVTGAAVGETRQFELTYPDDAEEYDELAGQTAIFTVTVKKIEAMTLPELTDEFAARVTENEETPLSLLELRMRVRENLTKLEEDRINNEYFREVLDSMVEQAEVLYPEPMVGEQVETILKRLDQDLRQRGLTLDDYKRLYNKTDEDLYEEYRDVAVQTLKRSLVMRTLVESEALEVGADDIEQEVDRIVARFGERSDEFRKLFRESSMRQSVVNDLMNQRVIERVMAIAKGEAPELAAATEEPAAAETEEE